MKNISFVTFAALVVFSGVDVLNDGLRAPRGASTSSV